MVLYVEAPNEVYSLQNSKENVKLFLGGGITNCPDWQADVKQYFEAFTYLDLTMYNPRRSSFDVTDPNASETQIVWEYNHLRDADILMFWFASGSLNPIVLYELGRWGNSSNKPVFIGCDPEYSRKEDVRIQTKLSRPDLPIFSSIPDICQSIYNYLRNSGKAGIKV